MKQMCMNGNMGQFMEFDHVFHAQRVNSYVWHLTNVEWFDYIFTLDQASHRSASHAKKNKTTANHITKCHGIVIRLLFNIELSMADKNAHFQLN